jgi:hypothetical protein
VNLSRLLQLIRVLGSFVSIESLAALVKAALPLPAKADEAAAWLDRIGIQSPLSGVLIPWVERLLPKVVAESAPALAPPILDEARMALFDAIAEIEPLAALPPEVAQSRLRDDVEQACAGLSSGMAALVLEIATAILQWLQNRQGDAA